MCCQTVVANPGFGCGTDLKPRAVPILPSRRAMNHYFTRQTNLRKSQKIFAQDFYFERDLLVIGNVLVVASAAAREIFTARVNALGGCGKYFTQPRPGEARLFFGQRRFHNLARKCERNKNCLSPSMLIRRQTRNPVATVDQFVDSQSQEIILEDVEGFSPSQPGAVRPRKIGRAHV